MKWIIRYLRGSADKCLKYSQLNSTAKIVGYVDVGYAGDLDNIRSMTGYMFCVRSCTVS